MYHTVRATENLKPYEPEADPEISIRTFESGIAGNKFETAGLFNSKGTLLFKKRGGKTSVNFTEDEAKKMKGNILTHNHPVGVSFSKADVNIAITQGLKEIRVVNKEENLFYGLTIKDPDKFYKKKKLQKEVMTKYDMFVNLVSDGLRNDINSGKIRWQDASKIHHHKIMERLAKFYKSDFIYEKTEGIF